MAETRSFKEMVMLASVMHRTTGSTTSTYPRASTLVFTGTRTGQKMPDWREKIRSGANATTPYSLDRTQLVSSEGGSLSYFGRQKSKPAPGIPVSVISGEGSGFYNLPPSSPAHLSTSVIAAEAIALKSVYSKIRQTQQHMNSPAVLAEFLDVIRQFGSPMRSIIDLTNRRLNRLALERRGLSGSTSFKRIKWSEIVASTYLEYAFGLAPLISDTKKLAEALARFQVESEFSQRRKAVGRGIDSVTTDSLAVPTVYTDSLYIVGRQQTRKTTECRVQYVVGLSGAPSADFGSNQRLLDLLGFRPENWVPALWEAVPWSWLIDYFANVGQILEAGATNTSQVTWISKSVTYKTQQSGQYNVSPSLTSARMEGSYGYLGSGTGTVGKYQVVRTTLTRSIPASLGVPPLVVEFNLKNRQLLNLAAVLMSKRESSSALWLT